MRVGGVWGSPHVPSVSFLSHWRKMKSTLLQNPSESPEGPKKPSLPSVSNSFNLITHMKNRCKEISLGQESKGKEPRHRIAGRCLNSPGDEPSCASRAVSRWILQCCPQGSIQCQVTWPALGHWVRDQKFKYFLNTCYELETGQEYDVERDTLPALK